MDPVSRSKAILECLKEAPLFQNVSDNSLKRLASVSSLKQVDKGTILYSEGEDAHQLYIVMYGNITEYVSGPNELEMIVKDRKTHDYFGEIAIITDCPQPVTAIASQNSRLVSIPKNEFLAVLRNEPSLSVYIIKILSQRLLLSAKHQIAFLYLDASSKLAYLLLSLEADSKGSGVVESTQENLAQRCGLSRQTVARILGEWNKADMIKTSRGKIEAINKKALKHMITISNFDRDIDTALLFQRD